MPSVWRARRHSPCRDPGTRLSSPETPPSRSDGEADIGRFLRLLSGRRHRVYSCISVIDASGTQRTRCAASQVRFKQLSDEEIAAYAASGEGIGKAGGYAIQGRAAGLIDFLSGSHSGVVGLPLFETRALLRAAGIALG